MRFPRLKSLHPRNRPLRSQHRPSRRVILSRLKQLLRTGGLAALMLPLACCGSPLTTHPDGSEETGSDSGAKTLRFVWIGDLTPLWHPAAYQTFSQAVVFYLLFNTLVKLDRDLTTIIPDLAKEWEVSSDARVYTFHLERDVRWHDGSAFTAEDVRFTFERQVLEPYRYVKYLEAVEGAQDYKQGSTESISGLELLDSHTLRVTLAFPDALFLYRLTEPSCVIIPEHLLKDAPPEGIESTKFASSSPVGTGPYKFVRYLTDQMAEFDVNPDYFKGKPQIEKVFMKRLRSEVAFAQLESGELDLALRLKLFGFERLTGLDRLNIISGPGVGMSSLYFTGEDPRLQDRRIRQAIYHAIDRKSIVEHVFRGRARVLRGAPPALDGYADLNPYDYNPEKSKRLLQEAGFDFEPPLRIVYDQTYPSAHMIFPIIEHQLRQVGINVRLDAMDSTAFIARIMEQRHLLEMFGSNGGAYGVGPHVSATYYDCHRKEWQSGYLNCELDDLFVQASRVTDLPTLPLWARDDFHAATKRLGGGFKIYRDSRRTFSNIETWTLASEQ